MCFHLQDNKNKLLIPNFILLFFFFFLVVWQIYSFYLMSFIIKYIKNIRLLRNFTFTCHEIGFECFSHVQSTSWTVSLYRPLCSLCGHPICFTLSRSAPRPAQLQSSCCLSGRGLRRVGLVVIGVWATRTQGSWSPLVRLIGPLVEWKCNQLLSRSRNNSKRKFLPQM